MSTSDALGSGDGAEGGTVASDVHARQRNPVASALLDLGARRRYRIMYGPQTWEDGSEQGHNEAREALRPEDVAFVAAALMEANDGVVKALRGALPGGSGA